MTIAEPAPGTIYTDNGYGFPITRGIADRHYRVGWPPTGKTWAEVLAWHQAAIDDPDDDTTEPFVPVRMVPSTAVEKALREAAYEIARPTWHPRGRLNDVEYVTMLRIQADLRRRATSANTVPETEPK